MKNLTFLDLSQKYQSKQPRIQSLWSDVLQHQKFVNGPECQQLETQLSTFLDVKHAVTVSSGTDALLCALIAAGVKAGDQVVTSGHSFAATVEAILMLGAQPVYVDVAHGDWNLDIEQVEAALTKKTKAILAVSLYGFPCDLKALKRLADQRGLIFIEDASQSLGAKREGLLSGAVAHMSVTSFFPSKPLGGAGNMGAVFTNDPTLATKLAAIRCHGQVQKYHHQLRGWNAMPSSLIAASLLVMLEDFGSDILKRQALALDYEQKLQTIYVSEKVLRPRHSLNIEPTWCYYVVQVPRRDEVLKACQELGLSLLVHYPHVLPDNLAFKGLGLRGETLEKARQLCSQCLSLPLYPDMKNIDAIVERFSCALTQVFSTSRENTL